MEAATAPATATKLAADECTAELAGVLTSGGEPETLAQHLVDLALAAGAPDNVGLALAQL